MNLVELTEFLVKSVSREPDMVSVKAFEEEEATTIQILVSKDDIGAVIGKGGSTAKAIRTIIQAAAYSNDYKKVRISIDSF